MSKDIGIGTRGDNARHGNHRVARLKVNHAGRAAKAPKLHVASATKAGRAMTKGLKTLERTK